MADSPEKKIERYLQELHLWGRRINLTSVKLEKVREVLVEPSLAMMEFIPEGNGLEIYDIGSGAGFPALALAIHLPVHHFTLVESHAKKSFFLTHVAAILELENVKVQNIRAEDLMHDGSLRKKADVVTARAVNRETVFNAAFHLLKSGGRVLIHRKSKQEKPDSRFGLLSENDFVEAYKAV